jgi:hypothetical protein
MTGPSPPNKPQKSTPTSSPALARWRSAPITPRSSVRKPSGSGASDSPPRAPVETRHGMELHARVRNVEIFRF